MMSSTSTIPCFLGETGMRAKLSVSSMYTTQHEHFFIAAVIELVLRRADRTFLPTFWLLSTLCHEVCTFTSCATSLAAMYLNHQLAHIKVFTIHLDIMSLSLTSHTQHMNHGHSFQALWRKLNDEVRSLQNKGYFGDGKYGTTFIIIFDPIL